MLKQVLTGAALLGMSLSSASMADDEKKDTKQQQIQIRVETHSSSTDKDGEGDAEVSTKGTIVIIGDDGKKKVYDLNGEIPDEVKEKLNFQIFSDKNLKGRFGTDSMMWIMDEEAEEEPRYMIGVACEKVNELLEKHLQLNGYGLVVTSVSEDMPAAKADLAEGDILLTVNDKKLDRLEVLVETVTESEGKPLKFTVLKKGEKVDVEIKPKKTTESSAMRGLALPEESFLRGRLMQPGIGGRMQLRQFGPGFRIGPSNMDQLGEAMKMLQGVEGIEGLQNLDLDIAIPELDVEVEVEEALQNAEEVNRALKKELNVMQKRLAAMEKQLKKLAEKAENKD